MTVLDEHLHHFARRLIQDALQEASSAYWERRADTFDTVGTPTADETALACRRHAWLLRNTGLDAEVGALIKPQEGAA